MKKITLLFTLFIFTLGFSQNGGNTCATSVAITPGNFSSTTITPGISGGEQGDGQPVNAAWFSFTPDSNGTIDVSACADDIDTRLYIGTGACGSLTTIAENDDCDYDNGVYGSGVGGVPVLADVTYYIEWDDYWYSSSESFDWTLIFNVAACAEPTNIEINVLDTSASFNWDTPAFGTPVGYDWEIVPQGNAQGVDVVVSGFTATTSANSGTVLSPSTDYDFYVRTDCDTDGFSGYFGPVSFTTPSGPPPANDLCSGALLATQQTNIVDADSANAISSSVENAINTDDITDCFGGGDASDDVWFSFVALTADVTITVDADYDSVITLYETSDSTCATISQIECEDSIISGIEELEATGLSIGDTYYFRIYSYSDSPVVAPSFTYKLWSSTTLSVENPDDIDNSFKYYPNPVKSTLYLKAQNDIQNVSIFNMLGQEVLRMAPDDMKRDIDMSSLQTGTYFVKVTINDKIKTVRVLKQ